MHAQVWQAERSVSGLLAIPDICLPVMNVHGRVPVELRRRGFIKLTGAGLAASTLGAIGFGAASEALAAAVRPFKLTATTETRNTCTYCSVACGVLIYSLCDRAKNARPGARHGGGPVRGRLCDTGPGCSGCRGRLVTLRAESVVARRVERPGLARIRIQVFGADAGRDMHLNK